MAIANELLARELEHVPRPFEKPMPTEQARRLPKRERLELCKRLLRDHNADQAEPFYRESYNLSYDEKRTPFWRNYESRWNFLYAALGSGRGGDLGQARREIECEDEHGHYWEPAWTRLRLIEDGWHKWEAEANYPRPVRMGEDRYLRDEQRRFRSKRRAEKWLAGRVRWYARYIDRLLAEGLYDEYGYER